MNSDYKSIFIIHPCKCSLYASFIKNGNCRFCKRLPCLSFFYKNKYYTNIHQVICLKDIQHRQTHGKF